MASEKLLPLLTLKDPETGKRPDHIVLPGGRSSGKSRSAATAGLFFSRLAKLKIVVAREFGSSIDTSFFDELKNAATDCGVFDEFEWAATTITHKRTGSWFSAIGLARNPENIKGLAGTDLLIVEEARTISQDSIDIVIPTIRKNKSMCWWLYNPALMTDPVAQTFVENTRDDTLVIHTTYLDNEFLPEKNLPAIEIMREADPEKYRWIYLGEYVGSTQQTLIPPSMVSDSFSAQPVVPDDMIVRAGLDVAGMGKDQTVLVRRKGKIVLDVHTMDKGTVSDIAHWVEELSVRFPFDSLRIDATGSTGVSDILIEKSSLHRRYSAHQWIASWASTRPEFYANARTELWFRIRAWLDEGGKLNNTSGHRWNELSAVEWVYREKEKKALKPKKELSRSPDWGDALGLCLWDADELVAKKQESSAFRRYGSYIG